MSTGTVKHKSEIQPRFWVIMFVILALLLGIAFIRNTRLHQAQLALANEVRDELNEAAIENAELQRTLAFMQTDQYVERQARREYGMLVQGDIRFVADVSSYSGIVSAWNNMDEAEDTILAPND